MSGPAHAGPGRVPHLLGDLRASGHVQVPVKVEISRNLLRKLRAGETLFPGIVGYDDTVLPQISNALIAGHDLVLLGERGQAKSRIMRSLVHLLDEWVPAVEGCEINDHPYNPICRQCRNLLAEHGDDLHIRWIHREERYAEKLATPDISIADLIGEVDPIKVAEGRYLSDELTIHYGMIPRANRGIFGINELPDLAERIQVGLFNVMEERDVQIRGYRIRLPLDLLVVASANPEDYTSRGRIVTPLKDRFGSQIRTHYPQQIEQEIEVMRAELTRPEGAEVRVPPFMEEIVAEISHIARRSPHVTQTSGVSVRMSISNYENLVANAVRRAALAGEPVAVPRISDLAFLTPSISGRIEFEVVDDGKERQLMQRIVRSAITAVFGRHLDASMFSQLVARFESGFTFEADPLAPSVTYFVDGFFDADLAVAVAALGVEDSAPMRASVLEFVLEGLHIAKRLNKDEIPGRVLYRK